MKDIFQVVVEQNEAIKSLKKENAALRQLFRVTVFATLFFLVLAVIFFVVLITL